MYDIAIITANYDNYDTIKPVMEQVGAKVEWVYVTDSTDVLTNGKYSYSGYTTQYQPREGLQPIRAAKIPKMKPWEYTTAPLSVWIDASFRVNSSTFAIDMIDVLESCDIAQFEHPWRDCIYEEAAETLKLARYEDVYGMILAQMSKYRNLLGHPDHWGLWAAGVIARRHTDKIKTFGELWLNENLGHSYQDQLSQAPMLRLMELRPHLLMGTHFSNPWLSYEGSGRH